jgi:hypothetical protein
VYVNFGSPSNACQQPDRQPNVPGQDPCPLLETYAGIFRFDENKLGQKPADGRRYSTGMRQEVGLTWHDNSLWAVMHNRDGLGHAVAGQVHRRAERGMAGGVSAQGVGRRELRLAYCFYNNAEGKLVNNPEYGGDGKKNDRCGAFTPPTGRVPRPLGAERRRVLHRDAVSEAVPGRRIRRVSRVVEPRAAADGGLQHHVRAVQRRQARRA